MPAEQDERATAAHRQFPCKECGAKLTFEPGTTALKCRYCGTAQDIPESAAEIRELDFETMLRDLEAGAEMVETRTVKCGPCGADVDLPDEVTALSCPFCGSDIVATEHSGKQIKPRAVLPFKVPRDDARAAFRKWITSRWFAPGALKHAARAADKLMGMYVPYWTYDCNTTSHYTGQRGEHYFVTVGSGKNRRTVMRTRWYPASGVVHNPFDDVLVMASHSLPDKHARSLEPWDLDNLEPYADAFLSGFGSERYQIDLSTGFSHAQVRMNEIIHQTVRQAIGGDVQVVHSVDTRWADISFKHILLPVWISAYRFKDRIYRFLINARTAEVQGERPYSWLKIAMTILGAIIVAGGAVALFNR